MDNLINKRFGNLVVISHAPPKVYGKRKIPACYCDCDCGTKNHYAASQNLKNGSVKSCGCSKAHKNLVGKKFGKLTIKKLHGKKHNQLVWLADCECGTKKYKILSSGLYNGTKSCGCISKQYENLVGKKFGKLTVLCKIENKKHTHFKCICDCGKVKNIRASHLKRGVTKSCGCINTINISQIHRSKINNNQKMLEMRLYRDYQSVARRRNISFDLTEEEFILLIHKDCFYCSSSPTNIVKTNRKKYKNIEMCYNGIDRVDNFGSYSINNCVSCCKYCNRCKFDMTIDEFKSYIRIAYLNLYKSNSII